MEGLRGRLTYANVVATLALFLALGGGAYAVSKIGSKQIKRNAVKSKHLAANAAKGRDVAEGTLGTVPNAARLGGRRLGEIVERIDFSEFGATSAQPVEQVQRVGGIDLTIRCTQVGGLTSDAVLEVEGDPVISDAILFDTTSSIGDATDVIDHRGGGIDGDTAGILFRAEGVSLRGNVWIVWREPGRTVSIQGRYDASRELSADCGLEAVATVAPA